MENFEYHNPTRIVFGKGQIAQIAKLLPADQRVMLTYGGGSIKRNGVYDQVKAATAGREVVEFGGIEPNPLYETLMRAVALGKQQNVGMLLAVGGGSVLDGTKFIAAAMRFGGEPWDILAKGATVASAVPIGAVLTLPATGSEANGAAVVSRKATQEKLAFISDNVFPQFSVLDPETTYSLPAKQVRNGIVDAFVHVMEQYATYPADAAMQDRQAEAVLLTLIDVGPRTLADPTDYAARAEFMWAATQALNGLIGVGVPQDWATHMIGHELTAFYGLDHAETLAIVLPSLLRHQIDKKQAKLAQMARRVFGVTESDDRGAALTGIERMEAFFHSVGMPTTFAAYKLAPTDAADKVRQRFEGRKTIIGEHQDIDPKRVAEILTAA